MLFEIPCEISNPYNEKYERLDLRAHMRFWNAEQGNSSINSGMVAEIRSGLWTANIRQQFALFQVTPYAKYIAVSL